ncbi:MAG: hypothetical protein HQL99_15200 [Magnetococcales bacterium]|nr:hypothetical protein [Magnetococcales bacterium]
MKLFRNACLSLLLLTAPLSVAWGDEPGKVNSQIAKTAAKVNMPAKATAGSHAARVQKDKENVRKIVLAKKLQRQAGKKADPKTTASKKAVTPRKPTHTTRRATPIPARIGIRTWSFPESAPVRTSKLTELTARITETENAYDAENAKFQKLLQKYSKEHANPMFPSATGNVPFADPQMAASQRRLNDIMIQLDALHNHRNEVAGLVFLKTVRD